MVKLSSGRRRVQYIYPAHVGYDEPLDANNCSVRALSNATGLPYEISFKAFERIGRRAFKGVSIKQCHEAYTDAGGRLIDVYGATRQAASFTLMTGILPMQSMTLKTLLLTLPAKGRYIAVITRHALAIVDGVIVDTGPSKALSRVTALYKFE